MPLFCKLYSHFQWKWGIQLWSLRVLMLTSSNTLTKPGDQPVVFESVKCWTSALQHWSRGPLRWKYLGYIGLVSVLYVQNHIS